MREVASLYLPHLAVERVRRQEQHTARSPEEARSQRLPVASDPGPCSVPRGGPWRPGARWAKEQVEAQISALPRHQQPPMRELGRRSEAADPPFRKRGHASEASERVTAPGFEADDVPLVLIRRTGRRNDVTARCQHAASLGITVGMAATQARALVPDLDVRPHDIAADMQLLDRLALHAVRHWTPVASLSGNDGLWLDLTGVSHLHGGPERFCRHVVRFCARAGFTARVAIAATPGAAHAAARYGRSAKQVIPPGRTVDMLSLLPIAGLRLDEGARAACRRFGFETIGDLLPVARGPLVRRLGQAAVDRLDQALGRLAEPIVPVRDEAAPEVRRNLLEPIGTPEQIATVAGDLVEDLCALLGTRGLGLRTAVFHAERVDGEMRSVAVGTSRATRDPAHLNRLFALKLDRIDPGFGLEAFRLVASRTEPLAAMTPASLLAEDVRIRDVAALVDRIAGRVGERNVFRLAPAPNHVPERAQHRCDPLKTPGGFPDWKRPVRMLRRPERLHDVMALLPDHPPRRFTWRGRPYAVVAGDGPERIHGEWWRREGEVRGVRDYFRVEDAEGRRFWIFRRGDGLSPETGDLSWHMHGLFG
nr:DUF6504 family protein [Pacificimonas flava]